MIVNIQYPCLICAAGEYCDVTQAVNTMKDKHGFYILNLCQIAEHRPPSTYYSYKNDINKKWDVQHFGCPSCWFHCPKKFEESMHHFMTAHADIKVEDFIQETLEDYSDEERDDAEEEENIGTTPNEEGGDVQMKYSLPYYKSKRRIYRGLP